MSPARITPDGAHAFKTKPSFPEAVFPRLFKIDINRYSVYEYTTNSKEIITLLKREGFTLVRVSGDHHKFRREDGRIVIVPHPKKDLPIGTIRNIFRQAGLKWRR